MPGARAAATDRGLPPYPPSATPGPGRQTFEDSMVHEVLCVTRRFTACCALHRCLSRGVLHDDVSGSRLGAGTPRCLSALLYARRRNATRRLPRLSGLTPFSVVFSAAQQPCRERRLPIALPRRAPCAPVTVRTQALDSFAPRVSLPLLPLCYGSTPPASLLVEDGRRPDDDVVILLCPRLAAPPQRREHTLQQD